MKIKLLNSPIKILSSQKNKLLSSHHPLPQVIHFLSLFSVVSGQFYKGFLRQNMYYDDLMTCPCHKSVYQTSHMLLQVLKVVIKLGQQKRCLKMVLGLSHILDIAMMS